MSSNNVYHIQPLSHCPFHDLSEMPWDNLPALEVASVHPESSSHTPKTQMRLAYQPDALYLKFEVEDQYVRCQNLQMQSSVCKDSCVEAFLKPMADKGYFNFEINVAGVLHASYIADHTRVRDEFKDRTMFSQTQLQQIQIVSDLHEIIDPEITDPFSWSITCRIPLAVFEDYLGPLSLGPTNPWQGNFYKCADHSSHPHWLSWRPIGEQLNFHQPQYFGQLYFN